MTEKADVDQKKSRLTDGILAIKRAPTEEVRGGLEGLNIHRVAELIGGIGGLITDIQVRLEEIDEATSDVKEHALTAHEFFLDVTGKTRNHNAITAIEGSYEIATLANEEMVHSLGLQECLTFLKQYTGLALLEAEKFEGIRQQAITAADLAIERQEQTARSAEHYYGEI